MEPDTAMSKPYHVSEIAKYGNKQVGTFKNIYTDWTFFNFSLFHAPIYFTKEKDFSNFNK